jgi:GNAT superfamily N-acetyltransferase
MAEPPSLPPRFEIRDLERGRDAAVVRGLYARAADYAVLETGLPPSEATVEAFFSDHPPGADPAASRKLGLFTPDKALVGIADLGFGFPEPRDAYLGLMLLDPRHRGRGLGRAFLGRVVELARGRGAPSLFLAVFEDNPRARAFWERAGFRVVLSAPPARIGRKLHVRHRMELRL